MAARSVAAWVLAAPVGLLLIIGTLVGVISGGGVSTTTVVVPIAALSALAMGTIIVTRLPHHLVGWVLWLDGLALALTVITLGLANLDLVADPAGLPGEVWLAWVNTWVGEVALFVLPLFLPLLYPTGRLPSPRWRLVAICGVVSLTVYAGAAALSPFPAGDFPAAVENPLALSGTGADLIHTLDTVLSPVMGLLLVLAMTSLVIRYRRAAGVERQQLKWLAFVGAIALLALTTAGLASGAPAGPLATVDSLAWLIGIGALAVMPATIGVAILRYRLYEIDRLISRTIAYALLSVILASVFVAVILALQSLISPLIPANQLAVAASTLLVFVLFQPLRRRVQGLVDRRFNRARYDAERTVAAFADRLRHEVDLVAIETDLLATTRAALEPASVALWLPEAPFGGRT
jgi:hypothetical protein